MAQTNDDIALRKYLKDTVGDKLAQIQQEQESINRSITSLTEEIGNISFPGFPDNYARKDDLTNLRERLALDKTRMSCRLSDEDTRMIGEVYQAYCDAKVFYDKFVKEKQRKRIILNINLSARVFGAVLALLGAGLMALLYWMDNQPAYLAHEYYEIMAQMDIRIPGIYYDDAYTKAKAGKQDEVREEIKKAKRDLERFQEYEAVLIPLLENRPLLVRFIQYESQTQCALVHYRFKDNDTIWKAFFLEDGSILTTDSELVISPYDARIMLTSKKVKWERIKEKK